MHTKIGANIFEAVGRENVFTDFGVHTRIMVNNGHREIGLVLAGR